MRDRETLEFLGLWEKLHNPEFKPIEFDRFKQEAGLHSFTMSPEKWIKSTNAKGIVSKRGRYGGGTYAHSDIAFEFASWVSAEFKLYIIKDYHRLKSDENSRISLNWNLNREISKINYRVHTAAVKNNLIPPDLTPSQVSFTYASEADVLNVALFGITAKEWRAKNKNKRGNIRDYTDINQLLILANLESYNAILIDQHKTQGERLILLREMVVRQLKIFLDHSPDLPNKIWIDNSFHAADIVAAVAIAVVVSSQATIIEIEAVVSAFARRGSRPPVAVA